ncbi:MAG: carbohydrate ABC transporter permease, partial [Oricola sp.]|nr:carbohydrate ABC transporter permease [Oricola sp.]
MARAVTTQRKTINTIIAWAIGLLIFFPILWIIILSFKAEGDAIKTPIAVLTSGWTLENYGVVQERPDYAKHFFNSVILAFGSTILGLVIAV